MANQERIDLIIGAKNQATSVLNSLKSQIIGIGTAYLSWKVASDFLLSSVKEAIEAEKAYDGLSDAIERHGGSWAKVEQRVTAFTSSLQKQLGISDAVVATGMQKLVDAGLNVSESMKAMKLATDVAAGAHIELERAIDLVAKTSVGITRGLTQVGIRLDETLPQAERVTAAMDALARKFGGAAVDAMDTTAGQLRRLQESFKQLQESLGSGLLGTLNTFIEKLINIISLTRLLNSSNRAFWANIQAAIFKATGEIDRQREAVADLYKEMIGLKDGVRPTTEQLEKLNLALKSGSYTEAVRAIMEYETHLALTANLTDDNTNKLTKWTEANNRWLTQQRQVIIALDETGDSLDTIDVTMREITEFQEMSMTPAVRELLEEWREGVDKIAIGYGKLSPLQKQLLKELQSGAEDVEETWQDMYDALGESAQVFAEATHNATYGALSNQINQLDIFATRAKTVFGQVAQDFTTIFIKAVGDALAAAVAKWVVTLLFFDVPANDRAAMRSGRDFAKYFSAGVFDGLKDLITAPKMIDAATPLAISGMGGIISTEFAASTRRTNIVTSSENLTGRSLVQLR